MAKFLKQAIFFLWEYILEIEVVACGTFLLYLAIKYELPLGFYLLFLTIWGPIVYGIGKIRLIKHKLNRGDKGK